MNHLIKQTFHQESEAAEEGEGEEVEEAEGGSI